MIHEDVREVALRPGLIWGFDFIDGRTVQIAEADLLDTARPSRGFRWLHFNLADQRTLRWLVQHRPLGLDPEVFTAPDHAQHAVPAGEALALVLHDLELEFHDAEPRVGTLRVAIGPEMIITGRRHPLRSMELIKKRIDSGLRADDAITASELLLDALADGFRETNAGVEAAVQAIEDELLKDSPAPDARALTNLRSLMVRLHRVYGGARTTLREIEEEGQVPVLCQRAVKRFMGRASGLDADLLAMQHQLRLLRDELDLQATQQTNRNLYVLSILSALLLPATLVTGIFGMNTGGLIWTSGRMGSLWATATALGSAAVVYVILRLTGFIRR